jgi:hypothetical protein
MDMSPITSLTQSNCACSGCPPGRCVALQDYLAAARSLAQDRELRMHLIDVYWSLPVNRIRVLCDCGRTLDHPTNVSLVVCPQCRRFELWHSIEPRPQSGPWSEPVMQHRVSP